VIQGLVSVVMPCFNGQDFVVESIRSILNQSYREIELIVIDDASTDETYRLLCSESDPRINLFRNPSNLGVVETRNLGFAKAKGEFIACMDQDDIAGENRLERQVARFRMDSDLAVLGTGVEYIDAKGKCLRPPRLPPSTDAGIRWRLLSSNCIHHPTVMFRRSFFELPIYSHNFPDVEDWELWLRIWGSRKFGSIPDRLLKHRRHSGSISSQRHVIQREAMTQLLVGFVNRQFGFQISRDEALTLYDLTYWVLSTRSSRSPLQVMLDLRAAFLAASRATSRSEIREIDADLAFFALRVLAAASSTVRDESRRSLFMILDALKFLFSNPTATGWALLHSTGLVYRSLIPSSRLSEKHRR